MADIPITREEKYLAYLTGDYKADVPKPITRQERYLYELCLKGMGGEISPEEIQKAVNDYLDKNPVKPGATTEEAAQIKKNAEEIASLKESISNKITKFYASSQGETHLADSDNGKIMDMMLYGKSEQKQYTGKNLLNPTLQTTTQNGVTCTNNGDGTYTLNGTASVNTLFQIVQEGTNISNGTYKVTGCPSGGSPEKYFIRCGSEGINAWNDTGDGCTSIISNNRLVYRITIIAGATVNNIIFKPMLVDASLYPDATYDDFEPYTGGQPSPSPDYPQEIKSVVNPTVKVCGKNLFTFSNDSRDVNGVIFEAKDGIITAKGTSTEDFTSTYFQLNYPKDIFTIGETYTFSLNSNDANLCLYAVYKENDIVGYKALFEVTTKCATVKIPDNVELIIRCVVRINATVNATATIQIEKGSEATAYEPYHEQTVALPYTLNAIPVNSGGNVTIDGQQYIADYVDVERGKLVRMVGEFVQNNQEWRIEKIDLPYVVFSTKTAINNMQRNDDILNYCSNYFKCITTNNRYSENILFINSGYILVITMPSGTTVDDFLALIKGKLKVFYTLATPIEIDLTPEEVQAFKALTTYYPTTNISVNSEQLDGYTVFNYPINMANGWNYVKQQIGDTREYIYDIDARTQDTDLQAAEAYVNSEYAVALTELEI